MIGRVTTFDQAGKIVAEEWRCDQCATEFVSADTPTVCPSCGAAATSDSGPLAAQRAIFVATLAADDSGQITPLSAPDRAGMEVAVAYIDDKIGAAS